MKSRRLVELDAEREARFPGRLVRAELGAPGAAALLDAQRIERVVAGVAQAEVRARFVQREVDVARHLDRHVQLEAGSADVAHARGAHARIAQVDLRVSRRTSAPAGDRSSGLTRASSSRAFGPITDSTLNMRR